MSLLQIKANQELFDAWRTLGYRIGALANIVQNDMAISEEDLLAWGQDFDTYKDELDKVLARTVEHITGETIYP